VRCYDLIELRPAEGRGDYLYTVLRDVPLAVAQHDAQRLERHGKRTRIVASPADAGCGWSMAEACR
jgi:hypothetical protein